LSESNIPVEYDFAKRRVVMKIENVYLDGTDFEYAYGLKVNELMRGGLRATVTLNKDIGRAIVVDLLADPNSGKLNTVYSFIPYKGDVGRDIRKFELTKSLKDGSLILIINYKHGNDTWAMRMKWNKDTGEFIDDRIHPYDDEFEEIKNKILDCVKNSELKELEKIDELTRVFRMEKLGSNFTSARLDMLTCDSTAQGIIGTEIIKILLEKMRSTFEIPVGIIIIIDETGKNLGEYWFDIIVVDKDNRIIYFVAEVKSHWAEKGNLDQDFNKTKNELKNHRNDVLKLIEEKKEYKLPNYGYAFSMNVLSNKIEIFVRKLDLSKGEWVKW
jgi:hypothetical protein